MTTSPGLHGLFSQSHIQDGGYRKTIIDRKTVFLMSLNVFCGRLSEKYQYLVDFNAFVDICFDFIYFPLS